MPGDVEPRNRPPARLRLCNSYSHTLETIFRAGAMGLRVVNVPIGVNPRTRDSRLMKSMCSYIWRSGKTILRSYVRYGLLRSPWCISVTRPLRRQLPYFAPQ